MPTTRPGFIWSGTEWIAIGQEAVVNPFYYQATAPTGAATGAIWVESDVDVPSIDSSQFLRWRKTMAGGETSLSGNDDSSLPLAYTPGYEQLYINGVLQVRGGDYTATTGTTVTGLTALVANDVVEIFSAVARTVGDVYTQTQSDARFVNKNVGGLTLIIPTSVTNGTLNANGSVTIGNAVGSTSVNGVFSSTYDSYRIFVSGGSNTTNANNLNLKLGASATGYAYTFIYTGYGSGTVSAAGSASAAACDYVGMADPNGLAADITVVNPFLSKWTLINASNPRSDLGGHTTGIHKVASSYTDFTIGCALGTNTGGTIRIYGYNNGA